MKYSPLVSIIIPAYKAEKYIKATLNSILNQSYTNWEIIVVEDGTHDDTEQICQTFAEENPQIRIVYQRKVKNEGAGPTRNEALKLARGELIAFLDADDGWLPSHLQNAVEALNNFRIDITYSTVKIFHSEENNTVGTWGPGEEELLLFPNSLYARNYITPSSVVMKRAVYKKVGLFDLNPEIQSVEDHDYWIRAISCGFIFFHLPEKTCLYRRGHSESSSGNQLRSISRDIIVLKKHYRNPNFSFRAKRRALAHLYLYQSYLLSRNSLAKKLLFNGLAIYYYPFELGFLKTAVSQFLYNLFSTNRSVLTK